MQGSYHESGGGGLLPDMIISSGSDLVTGPACQSLPGPLWGKLEFDLDGDGGL